MMGGPKALSGDGSISDPDEEGGPIAPIGGSSLAWVARHPLGTPKVLSGREKSL